MLQPFAEDLRLGGMRRADDRADGGIAVSANHVRTPALDHVAHALVHGTPVGEFQILQFARRGVARLDENKQTAIERLAVIEEGLHAVRAEIGVDGEEVAPRNGDVLVPERRFAEVCRRITRGGRADVVALAVGNDDQPLLLRIRDGVQERPHARRAVLLVVGDLHFDGGNNVVHAVDEFEVELPDGVRRVLAGLYARAHFVGQVVELGIQPHAGGILCFDDFFNEFIDNHAYILLNQCYSIEKQT